MKTSGDYARDSGTGWRWWWGGGGGAGERGGGEAGEVEERGGGDRSGEGGDVKDNQVKR